MEEILVAKAEDGQLIYLTKPRNPNELRRLKTDNRFFCPDCGTAVLLKIGDIKIPHFAHKSSAACGSGEPESSLHLQGKILLHQFFIDKKMSAEMEIYIPEIRQRADVLVDRKSVIEFQCSPIASSDVARRSAAYASQGLHFTWIAGVTEFRENKVQVLHIKEYQKEMLLQKGCLSYLLLLNPETEQFLYFSNLFHISGGRWVGKVASMPVSRQSYPFAVPKPLSGKEFDTVCAVFSKARNAYIKAQFFARNRYKNPFWLLCYELGLDMRELPETIGVPFRGADCILDHPVIWQLKVIRAYRHGISSESLLSSAVISLRDQSNADAALKVLSDYQHFLKEVTAAGPNSGKQSEVLYDIYCKSVRKLRK
ncbi:competence protein CoiA [Planococcus sp. MERTA32b]|nr:competence protein CoiA [Planococcus sp. MER TA 32b]